MSVTRLPRPASRQARNRAKIVVDSDRNRFEVTFDETGEAFEIRIERWARYTTGKRYWARCWTPDRPMGARYSFVISRAREMLVRQPVRAASSGR
jgi:hypothetical protein